MTQQMFLAKALYDNIAESPDELAFRRGDVLTVTELNTGGLDGWCLCSLRGKQGIAPRNRLKILSGMSDYSTGDESLTSSSNNLTSSHSWESSLQKPVSSTEKTSTSLDLYDEPNRSLQDYDVPPSRHFPKEQLKMSEMQLPNTNPSSLKRLSNDSNQNMQHNNLESSFYDTPQSMHQVAGNEDNMYDVPQFLIKTSTDNHSNRSSILSNASNDSSLTAASSTSNVSSHRSSTAPSICDSARSSLDVSSQELYDTPPRSTHNAKQLSTDSGLDVYDTPPKAKLASPASVIEDYDFPKGKKIDFGVPKVTSLHQHHTEKNKSKEHAIDDVYDIPKNNAPRVQMKTCGGKVSFISSMDSPVTPNEPLCVYDIPPQVTRDSVISARSDSSEEGQRLSTCSIDSRGSFTEIPTYDELPLEMDAALEFLTRLQQDIQKTASKFLGFVSSTWRKKESLQTKLYEIKIAVTGVKSSLAEYIKFSQGTLANASKLPDRKLVNKLYKQLNPLQNSYQLISSALKNLDEVKWQTDILAEPLDSSKSDDLGQIATLCKDLSSNARKLASLIQGNSTLLFPRTQDLNRTAEVIISSEDSAAAKPPIGPKSEAGSKQRAKMVQQRPLPPPPTLERPLPPTPIEDQMNSLRLRFQEKGDNFVNEDAEKEDIYANDSNEWVREYDYVHLESRDIAAQLKAKEERVQNFEKDGSPSESEHEHSKDSSEDPYELKLEADLEELDNSKQDVIDNASFDIDNLLEQDVKTPVNANTDSDMFLLDKEEAVNMETEQLDPNDKQVLVFYSGQMETHSTLLSNALDAFFCCVESNEPPKVFISHSKFVIVSAHKLVYIGDTLHRNIMHTIVKNKIMKCANQLCDCLKQSVSATKLAALQYPSVPAVQEMVDRVVEVSKAAHNLKVVISQASSL
ncbi:enhancer of filamentation 1-like [Haliotis cracherodii]|uniref:enhancer of filamentation 1-like n=1 Tax=Haliotis cracherodii TaxID=6455 RepID=UPI0039EC2119